MKVWIVVAAVVAMAASAWAQDMGEGDFDLDPLAALAGLGDALMDEGPEAGGSIRAKKEPDQLVAKRMRDPRNLEAKVEAVNKGKFPNVALRLRVLKPAKEGPGKEMAKNSTLVVYPRYRIVDGKVDLEAKPNCLNAGAFYFKRGDKIKVQLGDKHGKIWDAVYLERK